MYVYSPDIPSRFSGLYINYPGYWDPLSLFLFPGEKAAQISAVEAIHTVPMFINLVPITAGCTDVMWIQSVPEAFAHDRCCGNRTPDRLILTPTP